MKNPTQNLQLNPLRMRRPHGFTLVEMMLVLSIIAVLLGTTIYYISGNLESAKLQRVDSDIATITTQLKAYEMNNNFMPTTEQGLMALVKEPTTEPLPRKWIQLYQKIPMDPWNMPYVYLNPGKHNPNGFDLYSYGPTKQENDKEIGNWDNTGNKQ